MALNMHFSDKNENTTIGSFMIKKVISIDGNLPLTKAAVLMIKNNIGSVLVKLREKFSILTKTDIIRVLSEGKDPEGITIKAIVANKKVITCFASDSLEDAMLTMAKYKIERLIVIDPKDEKIIGIISSSDILRIAPGLLEIKREQQFISDASESSNDSFAGYCDSCSNFGEELQEIGGFALCNGCIAQKEELIEDVSDEETTM